MKILMSHVRCLLSPVWQRGQVMLITVLVLGSAILGASTIAGFLMVNTIRQSTFADNSAKAIFAADAGLDNALYNCFKLNNPAPGCAAVSGTLNNGATYNTSYVTDPADPTVFKEIDSLGNSGDVARALRIVF